MDPRITLASEVIIKCAVIYAAFLFFLYLYQRNLMYHPDTARADPVSFGAQGAEIVSVTTADGLGLQGWYLPPAPGRPVILYFHGNASHIGNRMPKIAPYLEEGYGVLLAEYRGYGGNPGRPSEKGFYDDARAYIGWLAERAPLKTIIYYGESIGSGPAVQMATEFPPAALVLEAPLTSAPDIARQTYFFVPVDLLMRDQYRNIEKIGSYRGPLLIVHGENDRTVPIWSGQRLFGAANEPRTLKIIDGAGHNDLYERGAALHVLDFLANIPLSESP